MAWEFGSLIVHTHRQIPGTAHCCCSLRCMLENKELGDNLQCRSPQRWKVVSSNWVQWAVSSWQGFKWPSSSEGALDLSSMQMRLMKLFNLKTPWQLNVLSRVEDETIQYSELCMWSTKMWNWYAYVHIYGYTNQFLLLKYNENEKSKSFQNKKYLEVIFCSVQHGFSTLPCAH